MRPARTLVSKKSRRRQKHGIVLFHSYCPCRLFERRLDEGRCLTAIKWLVEIESFHWLFGVGKPGIKRAQPSTAGSLAHRSKAELV
jgi:hypothetical protein